MIVTLATTIVLAGAAGPARAQSSAAPGAAAFPSKPIRIVVPLAPGGGADIMARAFGQHMGERLRQAVVVDNRPGGATMIGTELVARAPADGYTLVLASSSHAINPSLYTRVPFDPIKDFAAITLIATSPLMLVVHPSLPVRSVRDLVAVARSRPGHLNFASGGPAGLPHLAAELFMLMADVRMVHVPYKGMGPALTEILGGQVELLFSTPVASLPHARSGRLRALAMTGASRSGAVPDLPTIAEAGFPGYEASTWYALLAPAGVPTQTVQVLHAEVLRGVHAPELRERLGSLGVELVGSSPEGCVAHIRSEMNKWARVVKRGNIRAD